MSQGIECTVLTLVSPSTVADHAEEPEAKGFVVSGPDGSEVVSRGPKKKIYLKLS